MQSTEDILGYILDALGREMPATVVRAWFDDARVIGLSENTLFLETSSDMKRDIILSRYAGYITDSLMTLFGTPLKLEVRLAADAADKPAPQAGGDVRDFRFETFVVGDSNKFAAAAARAVAESPGQAYNPLFIYGGSGLGKTHLLYAIMNVIRAANPKFTIRVFSAELFTNDLVNALQNKTTHEFHQRYRSANLLLVDDIQFIAGRNFSQEEFFHTFNTLYETGHQIVLTSDRPPKDIPTLEERLRTRFESGLIVDIQPPDFETRMAIVKSKAGKMGIVLSDEVVVYLATVVTANVRQLEGTVKKIAAWRELMKGPVDISAAERAISDLQRENPGLNPTPDMILSEVSSFYGVEERDILGKNRQADIVNARQVCMYLVRQLTSMSLKEIGAKIFRRDHTTVMYAVDKVEELRGADPAFDKTVNLLIENIRGK